ncbi:MAG: hypothetical protein IJ224_03930 [Lachnospiraceae bacterium]|nr:hypothetical protein [Lachnospiraceae bacterium]
MTKNSIIALLLILAVAVVGGVYMYVFKPNMDDKSTIDSEVETLQARYDELKAQEVHRDEYIALTKEYNEKFDEAIEIFPATLDQEISVMFMKGIEKDQGNLQMDIRTVGLGPEELFYTLGGSPAVAEGEATETEEVVVNTSGSYDCYRATFPITYEGSYEGIKDLMDYIMAYKYRMNVTAINISYDSNEDIYAGTITLNAYCVKGGDRQADTVTTDVSNGVSNIFLGGSGAAAPASTGSASTVSASSNDVKILLNNAANDAGDGIVISAGSSSLSYGENDVATVDVKIEDNGGKKVATISLGGDDITVDIADDATSFGIYVGSSERVDSGDKNGIKLNVSNDTDIAVDVKVDGDDSSSPRFTMGSKGGTVRVN